nr:hypothetical protein Q903MT_gene5013 [Picea sitchensis]
MCLALLLGPELRALGQMQLVFKWVFQPDMELSKGCLI